MQKHYKRNLSICDVNPKNLRMRCATLHMDQFARCMHLGDHPVTASGEI